jgi:hypothetical protein
MEPGGETQDSRASQSSVAVNSVTKSQSALKAHDDHRRAGLPAHPSLKDTQCQGSSPVLKERICDNCNRLTGGPGKCEKNDKWAACIRCHDQKVRCSLKPLVEAHRRALRTKKELTTGQQRSRSKSVTRRQRSQSRGRPEAKQGMVFMISWELV